MSTTWPPELDELLSAAREARERAYAPYSKFRVGAALAAGDGNVFFGSNVENASYGLSMCAERAAVFAAVAAGFREFTAIAVAGPDGERTSPCGACRQVLAEFNPKMTIVFTDAETPVTTSLSELLPYSFGPFV